jgi:hypothetical protein
MVCLLKKCRRRTVVHDFKLSPCSECRMLSSGLFPGVCSLNANVSEHTELNNRTQAIRYKILGSDCVYIAVRSSKCTNSAHKVRTAPIRRSCFAMFWLCYLFRVYWLSCLKLFNIIFGSYTVHYRICTEWPTKSTELHTSLYFMWWLLHVSAIIMSSSGSS